MLHASAANFYDRIHMHIAPAYCESIESFATLPVWPAPATRESGERVQCIVTKVHLELRILTSWLR